jgi:hypothetical protein
MDGWGRTDSARPRGKKAMDDPTAQEWQLIMTLRVLRSFSLIVHRNKQWHIVLADHEAGGTQTGDGEDFESAWDELSGNP